MMSMSLLPGVSGYAKMETKDCRTPLTLYIDYKKNPSADLTVYASFKHKLPDGEKCDFSMSQQSKLIV